MDSKAFFDLKSKFETEVEKLKQMEKGENCRTRLDSFNLSPISDSNTCMQNRRQLESQLTENSMVQEVSKSKRDAMMIGFLGACSS